MYILYIIGDYWNIEAKILSDRKKEKHRIVMRKFCVDENDFVRHPNAIAVNGPLFIS